MGIEGDAFDDAHLPLLALEELHGGEEDLTALQVKMVLMRSVENDPDYESNLINFGVEVAVAAALAKECVEVLGEERADGHLGEIIRDTFENLSPEAQAAFCEQGF